MSLIVEKKGILRGMTKRATTKRAVQILLEKYDIDMRGYRGRKALWSWLNIPERDHIHAEKIAAAYLEAIAERNNNIKKLVKPQRKKAIESARRLVQEG